MNEPVTEVRTLPGAAWGGGSVSGFAPDGTLLRTIAVPVKQPTCPCFTGAALDRMIVTSAWEGYDTAQRRADPEAGHTFEIAGGFAGLPAPDFLLSARNEELGCNE